MRRISILATVLALALAACGGVAETVADKAAEQVAEQAAEAATGDLDVETDDEQVSISGTDAETGQEVKANLGGTDVPDGFPMPIVSGAEVVDVTSVAIGENTNYEIVLRIDPGELNDILDFYEGWMQDQGMEIIRTEDGVLGSGEGENGALASVTFDGDDEIALGWLP